MVLCPWPCSSQGWGRKPTASGWSGSMTVFPTTQGVVDVHALNLKMIRYLPLEEVITDPGDGHWDVWTNRWWTRSRQGACFLRQVTSVQPKRVHRPQGTGAGLASG